MTTTFTAQVTMTGDAAAGTLEISMVQLQAPERPDRPPIEPPSPPTSPPVSPPEPPPNGGGEQPPVGEGWNPPAYLRTDTDEVSIPKVPRPAYLAAFTDPVFHTKITRITGDPGTAIRNISGARWGDVARHHYNSDQAWNCDQTLIYLDTNDGSGAAGAGDVFLDGSTYEPRFERKNKPSGADVRWHATDPALMVYAAGNKYGTWNPKTGGQVVIRSFDGGFDDLTFGEWEGSPSVDGNVVVLSSENQQKAFAYDVAADKQYNVIDASDVFGTDMGSCRISPLGTYMVWKFSDDVVVVTDLTGRKVTTLPNNYISHFDVIVDQAGDEVVVGRVNSSSVNQGPSGQISKYRLKDGKRTGLMRANGWCSHTSTRASKTRRWAVSGATPDNKPYYDELIMAALDGSAVYRLGHTRSSKDGDYVAQVQPSHSPDGGRVIFATDWGVGGSEPRPVGCYVVDFRT